MLSASLNKMMDPRLTTSQAGLLPLKFVPFYNGTKEGNVLFNDALNTFRTLHGLLFLISSKGFFFKRQPSNRIAHTVPVVEY